MGRGLNPIREGAAMSPRGEISEIENHDYSAAPVRSAVMPFVINRRLIY